jgi:hypothetical protein
MKNVSVDSLFNLDPTIYEEDSFHFLSYYQTFKDWYTYDSDELGLNTVKHLSDTFCAFHGKIPFPNDTEIKDTYWSTLPLGVFRFKLFADMSYGLAISANKDPGYIVSGVYWDNGFCYAVFNDDKIIQIKLFIDQYTKDTRDYPDTLHL